MQKPRTLITILLLFGGASYFIGCILSLERFITGNIQLALIGWVFYALGAVFTVPYLIWFFYKRKR